MINHPIRRAVGLFFNRLSAEAALNQLRDTGFNMDRVSVIARDSSTTDRKDAQIRNSAGAGAIMGGATGGLLGLIGSLGVLAIPAIGPATAVGIVLANTLLGTSLGAAGGTLLGALLGWGLPEEQARYYNSRVYDHNGYLIMVEGTEQDIRQAELVLSHHGIQDWNTFETVDGHVVSSDDRVKV